MKPVLPQDLVAAAGNRRSFVRNLGLATAAAGIIASSKDADAQSSSLSVVDVLNFALNLEYLEAEFYTVATTGGTINNFGITITGSGTAGATTGGGPVSFPTNSTLTQQVAQELAEDERFHVALLQNTILALGGTPIAKPAINLNALGIGFTNQNDFLTLARIFEEIGVTAYGGAAPLLVSNPTVLGYAARILATEAEHVGFIRALINQIQISVTPLDPVDVAPPPYGGMYFSTNSNAITAVRTPAQVLYLAFGGGSLSKGGFFPAGINGNSALGTSSATPATTDGSIFMLDGNPSPGVGGYATTTVVWSAPSATAIEIRIGSPNGQLFTHNSNAGSLVTGAWVTNGMTFYLQDVSPGKTATGYNATIATVVARVY
jgi:hypothetical protein